VRQVTIHVVDGQTDRDLERALLALDPAAQVHRVSGRLGRTGVRVCAHLAIQYLANEEWGDTLDALAAFSDEDAPTEVEVTATYGVPEPEAAAAPLVAEAPKTTPARPKKSATKKKTEEV
jgi:hypothetical protein